MHRVLANGSMSFFVHFLDLNKEVIKKTEQNFVPFVFTLLQMEYLLC